MSARLVLVPVPVLFLVLSSAPIARAATTEPCHEPGVPPAAALEAKSLYNEGIVEQSQGHYPLARQALSRAADRIDSKRDPALAVATLIALAGVETAMRQYDAAERALGRASELAAPDGPRVQRARVKNAYGNLYAAWAGQTRARLKYSQDPEADEKLASALRDRALGAYDESAALAAGAGPGPAPGQDALVVEAKARINAALAAAQDGRAADARTRTTVALKKIDAVSEAREMASLLLTAARADQLAAGAIGSGSGGSGSGDDDVQARRAVVLRARDSLDRAVRLARSACDERLEAYADGYLATLYERFGAADDARRLAERALFLAQRTRDPDATYRWQWLVARLLGRDAARRDDAIAAYQRALQSLSAVRSDVALGYGNGDPRATFRTDVAPIYYQLADLLLRRAADGARSEAQRRQDLLAARDAVELLKVGELADYFKDPCENTLQRRAVGSLGADARTAVVYYVPLEDRTEILLALPSQANDPRTGKPIENVVRVDPPSPIGAAALESAVNEFRQDLQTRSSTRYLEDGQRLYEWLIRPAEPLLVAARVQTLVFVPDGALRTIPLAALRDGRAGRFLIEQYAVAVTPGLTLTESDPIRRQNVKLLVNGLSEGVQGFNPLPNVPTEIENIRRTFGARRGTTLLNGDFRYRNVRARIANDPEFSIIHIASHGEFAEDARDTFLLTYDDRLTLDRLQELIAPKKYAQGGQRPVDLLTLSACRTAAGDDRAALGLAGVAIKAGARSALASLWYMNDTSSVELITSFYQQMAQHPEMSKAQALQAAQVRMLKDPDLSHPLYWAPFLLIGNWQ